MRVRPIAAMAAGLVAVGLVMPIAASAADAEQGWAVGDPSIATQTERGKIDVMGIWAHPDDDAGFTTPCGIWNDLYGTRCGIIMVTRGEGGSNSVGSEAGPDLGLRRENEDRISHVRSGTVDIFNLDRVDFYYNTSAPLTAQVWDAEETLRRTVRVIRETQPEILVGSNPSLASGHGNHQYAQGRMVWEAAEAAADPTRFPEQLTGVGAVEPWQVKKILAGGMTTGSGGIAAPECNTGFTPAADNPFTVVGTWTGYDSPYTWLEGNLAGQAAGSAKTWAQVGREGGRAHPTQARVMQKTVFDPTCQRYGVSQSIVPMQPNSSPDSARDDAVLFGATVADPGGMPLGSIFALETDDYFVAAGEPFQVSVSIASGGAALAGGEIALQAPAGWTVSSPVSIDAVGQSASEAQFTVTPAADATVARYKLGATFTGGGVTAYNDTRVQLVAPVEGRFERWGTAAEYDEWTEANQVFVGNRSNAVGKIGAGESVTVPVVVTNRTSETQSGEVTLSIPETARVTAEAPTLGYTDLPAGESTTVNFVLTHTDPTDAGSRTESLTVTTTSGAGQSTEAMTMYVVPTVVIPQLASAPTVDGEGTGMEDGATVSLGARWEGAACEPDGVDCGAGSTATLGWHDDALYAQITVVDDRASAAATPERCFGHWLVDSVELLLDPQGDSIDTSSTFKLGIFPFTDDPTGANGNGVDGPCWSRDADNHQGFSTGPLADTIEGAPNAPGVEVAARADRDESGAYIDGRYTIQVKMPLANLPIPTGPTSSAPTGEQATNEVDPAYLGLNVTPYDSDTSNFIGKTRTAWSAFGSQQSEPYRWGHAYLDGYVSPTPPTAEAPPAIIPDTALTGVESPQTVYQSAARGGTVSGVQPSDALTVSGVEIDRDSVSVRYTAAAAGTARVFLWKGDPTYVPVWTSSCTVEDPYGFEACAETDGAAAPWAPDMGGRLLGQTSGEVTGEGALELPIDAETYAALDEDVIVLVSYAESANDRGDGVNAWSFPVVQAVDPDPEPTSPPSPEPTTSPDPTTPPSPGPSASPDPSTPGTDPGGDPGDDSAGPSGPLGSTGGYDVLPIMWVAAALLLAGTIAAVVAHRRRLRLQQQDQ